jgi:pimeloyl-ACP methyl ester carboxylesterase
MRWLLLPGLDGTGQLFAPLLERLPDSVTPCIVSYPPDQELSIAQLVEHVRSQLPPADESFVLLAESFSGPVALRLAATRPPGLRAVVLCASFAFLPFNPLLRSTLRVLSHLLFYLPVPAWAVRLLLAGPDAPASLLSVFYHALATVRPAVLGQRVRLALDADERPSLVRLSVPLLWVQPSADFLLGCYRPGSRAMIVNVEAPHFVLQRKPTEVVGIIHRWMERQAS